MIIRIDPITIHFLGCWFDQMINRVIEAEIERALSNPGPSKVSPGRIDTHRGRFTGPECPMT
jgi:hypothetical protein